MYLNLLGFLIQVYLKKQKRDINYYIKRSTENGDQREKQSSSECWSKRDVAMI